MSEFMSDFMSFHFISFFLVLDDSVYPGELKMYGFQFNSIRG